MRNNPKEERDLADDAKHKGLIADFQRQLTAWRADKPAPVKIAGMPLPDYASISDAERKDALENRPPEI